MATEVESSKGASYSMFESCTFARNIADCDEDERLIAAARTDNEEMLLEVFESGDFDINYQDGCVTGILLNSSG